MLKNNEVVRKHVVITGTGRTGTTFLVQLLTDLGLDTGFTHDNMVLYKNARAGLENDIRKENAPYIVKHPSFCEYVDEVISRDDIEIEHVFIPMRNITEVSESRWRVVKETRPEMSFLRRILKRPSQISGGLLYTNSRRKQSRVLVQSVYDLLLALSNTQIPITIMRFPKIITDCEYLYKKLLPILQEISYEQFSKSHKKIAQQKLVHKYSKNGN